MNRNNVLCLFVILACFLAVEAIVAGREAQEHQFPYQVTVYVGEYGPVCGGGIIDDRFILTAAYCIVNERMQRLRRVNLAIVAGTNDLQRAGPPAVIIYVKTVFIPLEFPRVPSCDIAVLKLVDSLQLSQRRPNLMKLELPSRNPHTDEVATITGFGYHSYQNISSNQWYHDTDGKLRYATANVIRDDLCVRHYAEARRSPVEIDRSFCAYMRPPPFFDHSRPYGVCSRDHGSPLVHNGIVIGILTRPAPECNERYLPAVYTRVAVFSSMIYNIVTHNHDSRMTALES